MTTLVSFDHVSKIYRRTAERTNLRAALPGRIGRGTPANGFAALSDVSFSIEPGENLAFVGPNGAGKSTLLKLVARVVAPTRGTVRTAGRLASLIELGVGFHPDLTGSENVRFAGAILGMRRADVERRFDEIVEFSGLSSFLDMPVKRYSSGMLARLGFAVASHLDADVLVVDEVLSVGDAEFQRKGYERIASLRGSGASVLFVTHNLWVVPQVCQRAIRLDHGKVVDEGPAAEVVDRYRSEDYRTSGVSTVDKPYAGFDRFRVSPAQVEPGGELDVDVAVDVRRDLPDCRLGYAISMGDGLVLTGEVVDALTPALTTAGRVAVRGRIGPLPLRPGGYRLWVTLLEDVGHPVVHDQATFDFFVSGVEQPVHDAGFLAVPARWSVEERS